MTTATKPKPIQVSPDPDFDEAFLSDVVEGLSRPQKAIPCKYLYDERGSKLFEDICRLDEYYVTRTETALLAEKASEIARLIGPNAQIVEPGSGAGEKIQILLKALERPARVVPIDISLEILERSAEEISRAFPEIDVFPVHGDFTTLTDLGLPRDDRAGRTVCFFPGSTIGNFEPEAARALLSRIRSQVGEGGGLLIGVDLIKDATILERAYDDSEGVTAAFTENILAHVNRELDAGFDLSGFRHRARFNAEEGRIEIYLESLADQSVQIAGHAFSFAEDEQIHIENSYKYSLDGFKTLGREAGWSPKASWHDAENLFSIHFFDA